MPRKSKLDNDIREMLNIIRESEDKNKERQEDNHGSDNEILPGGADRPGTDTQPVRSAMNDAKFQFRYKVGDGAGCYIWSNPYLPISDKTIQTLSKVNGVCKNWRDEISKSEDSKPSNYKDPDDVQDNTQGQGTMEEGDAQAQAGQQPQQAPMAPGTQPGQQAPVMERVFRRGDDIIADSVRRRLQRGDDIW